MTKSTKANGLLRAPSHEPRATAPWTVLGGSVALVAQAAVVAEHARRLLAGTITSEETLGLAALRPFDREVPAAVIEGFVAIGLVIAAVAIARRSRLALAYAAIVQAAVLVEVAVRVAKGLAFTPTVALLTLGAGVVALLGAPATRRWCDLPIFLRRTPPAVEQREARR